MPVSASDWVRYCLQAEEERKAAEEAAKKAAADKAAAEKDDNPVAFLTNLMTTKTPVQVATAAKELDVEGGPAGRIRVLFEVGFIDSGISILLF